MANALLERDETSERPTPIEAALDAYDAAFDTVLGAIREPGLGGLPDASDEALVGLLHRWERHRNRTWLVDHTLIGEGETRGLPAALAQPSMAAVVVCALRLSRGDAARRTRAAAQLGDRRTMTGQPLEPLRPALAAAQAAGHATPEQLDVCLRAIEQVDHRGFRPADLDAADRILAGHITTVDPAALKVAAQRVIDHIDPDGTRPDDDLQHERRHLTLRTARDGMTVGEFRLTAGLGAKLRAVLSPLAAPRPVTIPLADDCPSGKTVEPDPRHPGQRLHDALDEVCERLLRSGTVPDSGGTPASVIITISVDDLTQPSGTGRAATAPP